MNDDPLSEKDTEIAHKVFSQIRITPEEGLYLLKEAPDALLQSLANTIRERFHKEVVSYCNTLYIHPTNLCELSCPMCSFYAKPGWKTAWFLTPKEIEEKVRIALSKGICEVHIVGGLWRDCTLDYYQEIFSRIHALDSSLHIKALTPVEYDFLAKLHGIPVEEVLSKMKSWGLGSLPGGGAEILVEEIRTKIAPGKISSEEFLSIHQAAHQIGIPSNITMLFGHIESEEHIIAHLDKVRRLQDTTGGFQAFVPLKYHEENNSLGKRKDRLKPKNLHRIYGISRIMLDNIPSLKVLWNYVGPEVAQEILDWGANDFSSTSFEEKIITMAGGVQVTMTEEVIQRFISEKNRTPRKVHSGHINTSSRILHAAN